MNSHRGQLKYPVPIDMTLDDKTREIVVRWTDGHHARYPMAYIRGYCGCSVCEKAFSLPWLKTLRETRLVAIEPINKVALKFHFSDGHVSSTLHYKHFRGLCPCPDCAPGGLAEIHALEND